MNIFEMIAYYSASMWLLVIGPRAVITYSRCIIHDHAYITGVYDVATAVCILALVKLL